MSVVIPSRNDAVMLERCLADLSKQTRLPDEVIVVDNGSTDDTVKVGERAGARVVTEPVVGVLRATTVGFDAATGDIIGRLDADSRPDPNWVARVVAKLEADPALSGVSGPGIFYGRGPFSRFIGRYVYIGGYYWSMGLFFGRTPVFGSNMALRRKAWEDARPRLHLDDPRMHDDLDITNALSPERIVEHDPRLIARVSARPFDSLGGLRRRATWAFHDLGVYVREGDWWERRKRSRAAVKLHRSRAASARASRG